MLGSRAPILTLCQKRRPFRPQFWKNNFWEHLWSRRGYSRYYFKPNFRSLGQLVSILWVFFVEKFTFSVFFIFCRLLIIKCTLVKGVVIVLNYLNNWLGLTILLIFYFLNFKKLSPLCQKLKKIDCKLHLYFKNHTSKLHFYSISCPRSWLSGKAFFL